MSGRPPDTYDEDYLNEAIMKRKGVEGRPGMVWGKGSREPVPVIERLERQPSETGTVADTARAMAAATQAFYDLGVSVSSVLGVEPTEDQPEDSEGSALDELIEASRGDDFVSAWLVCSATTVILSLVASIFLSEVVAWFAVGSWLLASSVFLMERADAD